MPEPQLPAPSLFDQLRFVLVETSHPGNVGSVARAMKTMGFSQLVLVKPRFADVLTHPEAIALASGATDVLEQARVVDTIQEALDCCDLVAAVSARLREFSPPVIDPREFARILVQPETRMCAVVLGNERFGLPNEIVQMCNYLIQIPANPNYSSLNLAQAVQVLAYECRYSCAENTPNGGAKGNAKLSTIGFKGESATSVDIEGMFIHLEQGLIALKFIDPEHPKKLMPRLKRLFARTQLETEEVNILRGIAKKMLDKNQH